MIDELLREETPGSSSSAKELEFICTTLGRAKNNVLELEKFIAYDLTKETNSGAEVDRLTWMRSAEKIGNAKNNIRRAREDLNTVWVTLSQRHERQLNTACRNLFIG